MASKMMIEDFSQIFMLEYYIVPIPSIKGILANDLELRKASFSDVVAISVFNTLNSACEIKCGNISDAMEYWFRNIAEWGNKGCVNSYFAIKELFDSSDYCKFNNVVIKHRQFDYLRTLVYRERITKELIDFVGEIAYKSIIGNGRIRHTNEKLTCARMSGYMRVQESPQECYPPIINQMLACPKYHMRKMRKRIEENGQCDLYFFCGNKYLKTRGVYVVKKDVPLEDVLRYVLHGKKPTSQRKQIENEITRNFLLNTAKK